MTRVTGQEEERKENEKEEKKGGGAEEGKLLGTGRMTVNVLLF